MGNLKIGFVLDDTLDTPDGVQQYILTLGTWLRSQGHDVHYLVGYTERTDIPNVHSMSKNIRVKFNGNRMSTPLPARKGHIKALLQREQFDVLHVQIPYSPYLAQKIILCAPKETAVVGTFHIAPNSVAVTWANKILGKMVRRSLERFDTIFSVSPAAAEFARLTHGLETPILPNVVQASHFRQAEPYTSDGRRTIVFLGRLVPRKGCQILLEAVSKMSDNPGVSPFKVIICGRGPLGDELMAYTKAHKLQNFVEFAGFVDDDIKARYLRSADIAVFPSTGGESFGIVLLEAMAAEHPVVLGADNDGYKSVLAPYPEILFPVNDPGALADKLTRYLTDNDARAQALAWQKNYIQQFDVSVVGRRLVTRYLEALRARRSS